MSSDRAPLSFATGVIDAHTHVFWPEVCAKRTAFCNRDRWFGYLYANEKAGLVTIDDLIASMDDAGIGGAILCGFPWTDPGLCRDHNAYMSESQKRFPDRIRWLAAIAPHGEDSVGIERDLADAVELGAIGCGELNADAQGFDFASPSWINDVAEVCKAWNLPIMFHVSEPVGHPYPGKGTVWPQKLVPFLERHRDLHVIAAHWGGGLPFYELMPEIRSATINTVYDSAASTYLYDFNVFRTVLDLVGHDRVLFGSDYPVLRQKRFLERVEAIPWRSDEERLAVLGANARRLFVDPIGSKT